MHYKIKDCLKVISEVEQTPFLDPLVSKFNYFTNGTAQLRTALMISWKYKRDFKRVLTANLFDSTSTAKYGKSDTTKKAKTRITFKLNSK